MRRYYEEVISTWILITDWLEPFLVHKNSATVHIVCQSFRSLNLNPHKLLFYPISHKSTCRQLAWDNLRWAAFLWSYCCLYFVLCRVYTAARCAGGCKLNSGMPRCTRGISVTAYLGPPCHSSRPTKLSAWLHTDNRSLLYSYYQRNPHSWFPFKSIFSSTHKIPPRMTTRSFLINQRIQKQKSTKRCLRPYTSILDRSLHCIVIM